MRLITGFVLAATLLLSACADDQTSASGAASASTSAVQPAPAQGPTTSSTVPAECADIAEEYVAVATRLFSRSPSDAAAERSRTRFDELDQIAGQGGCGETYRAAVCDGLDELAKSGVLVIFPLVTARCI